MRKLLFALVLSLCLAPVAAMAASPLKVVASFSILGDMVKNVVGDKVQVTTLVGPNADTHTYQPTPADAKTLAQADMVVVNGLHLEGWLDRLIKASGYKGPVVTASKGVTTRTMIDADEGGKKITDPHAWQNLSNGKIYAVNIEKGLTQADPANAATYAQNARDYTARMDKMDAWVKSSFNAIPRAKRKIITSHDAFGYFGEAYGVTLLSPMGVSTESEASAQNVGKLVRQIKKEKVKALFIENMTDPRLVENIARETGVRPGGELYSDALSAAEGPAGTYLDMFKNNVALMTSAMTRP